MSNNAGNTPVQTVTPVVPEKKEDKLIETKVTVIEGKEHAAILTDSTVKMLALAFTLQSVEESDSLYQKFSLETAASMFLKQECRATVSRWDNLVTKFSKTSKYRDKGRVEIEKSLRDNPKTRPYASMADKANAILKSL